MIVSRWTDASDDCRLQPQIQYLIDYWDEARHSTVMQDVLQGMDGESYPGLGMVMARIVKQLAVAWRSGLETSG